MQINYNNTILNNRASILPVTVISMFILVTIGYLCTHMLMLENIAASKEQIKKRVYYAAEGVLNEHLGKLINKNSFGSINSEFSSGPWKMYIENDHAYHNVDGNRPIIRAQSVCYSTAAATSATLNADDKATIERIWKNISIRNVRLAKDPIAGTNKFSSIATTYHPDSEVADPKDPGNRKYIYAVSPYFFLTTAWSDPIGNGKYAPRIETVIGTCVYAVQTTHQQKGVTGAWENITSETNPKMYFIDKVSEIIRYGVS